MTLYKHFSTVPLKRNPCEDSAFVDKAVNQIITAAESAMGEKLSCKATD